MKFWFKVYKTIRFEDVEYHFCKTDYENMLKDSKLYGFDNIDQDFDMLLTYCTTFNIL